MRTSRDWKNEDHRRVLDAGDEFLGTNTPNSYFLPGGWRSDGYLFSLIRAPGCAPMIRAGCRRFTLRQARAHWADRHYRSRTLAKESLWIIATLVQRAKDSDLMPRTVRFNANLPKRKARR